MPAEPIWFVIKSIESMFGGIFDVSDLGTSGTDLCLEQIYNLCVALRVTHYNRSPAGTTVMVRYQIQRNCRLGDFWHTNLCQARTIYILCVTLGVTLYISPQTGTTIMAGYKIQRNRFLGGFLAFPDVGTSGTHLCQAQTIYILCVALRVTLYDRWHALRNRYGWV